MVCHGVNVAQHARFPTDHANDLNDPRMQPEPFRFKSRESPLLNHSKKPRTTSEALTAFPGDLVVPGLTAGHGDVPTLTHDISQRSAVLEYASRQAGLWVVFLGGTGTGKSTLYNALCEKELSRTGVERPNTRGPVVHAHEESQIESGFPFPFMIPIRRPEPGPGASPESGEPGRLVILDHRRRERAHLVVVDTPDLDSLNPENRRMAEALALLADAVVFVASQEKYADEAPSLFLQQVLSEDKPVYVLLNKADPAFGPEDAMEALKAQGIPLHPDRFWLVPRTVSNPSVIAGGDGFRAFQERLLSDFSPGTLLERRETGLKVHARILNAHLERLVDILGQEDKACEAWLKRLEDLFRETSDDLFRAEGEHFTSGNHARVQREIRRLFSRYDLLARPRRAVQQVLLMPLRLLGFNPGDRSVAGEKEGQETRVPENIAPMVGAVDRLNRRVLEMLSPADPAAPLFAALREPGAALSRDEVETRVTAEQERLETWLRETFERMSRGLPRIKKWSIYSTSVVWGVLVIALEATLGGGFTVIDALLGSALAPFLTKGSAELFAFREIRSIVREMADMYRRGLVSILEEQRDRYASALARLRASTADLERIQSLRNEAVRWMKTPPLPQAAPGKHPDPASLTRSHTP